MVAVLSLGWVFSTLKYSENPAVGSVGSGVSVSFDHGARAALWEGEGGTVRPGDPPRTWASLTQMECDSRSKS